MVSNDRNPLDRQYPRELIQSYISEGKLFITMSYALKNESINQKKFLKKTIIFENILKN